MHAEMVGKEDTLTVWWSRRIADIKIEEEDLTVGGVVVPRYSQ